MIFDGSENWMSSGGGFYLDNISAIADVSRTIKPACNLLRWDEDVRKAMSDIAEGFIAFSTAGNQINLKTSAFSAVGEFKDFISENNLQVCGYLVTPVTYQLTPLEVRTVLGQNSVSADCGAVSLRYGADTKLYIDGKFAELQALVLENG